VTSFIVVGVRTWPEIHADFSAHWWVYLSMPFVAAFVGYTTKLMALAMLYRPLEFRGIGPFGWQGIVPRRAGKVAATTIELLTENLLRPEELLEEFDAELAIAALREPLMRTVEEIARELVDDLRPGLWDSMPEYGRTALMARVEARTPAIADRLLAEMKADLGRYLDITYLTVTTLVRNKAKLNNLMKSVATDAMAFVRRSGIYFGFAIGLLQMVCWSYFHNPWLMPGFGFAIGFFSDWIALNMLFRPLHPRPYGPFRLQGVLHARRDQITRDYAKILATELFAPDVVLEAILEGPTAEKLFDTIQREVEAALDREVVLVQPLVRVVIGTRRYRELRLRIVATVMRRLPDTMVEAKAYASRVIDVENTIVHKMSQLTDEQYEGIMRPVFKDDEPLMIAVGAVLGGLVGELQVVLVEHLGAR
jgi:uncharacterized membrane protein YheB (UPF0754 family)